VPPLSTRLISAARTIGRALRDGWLIVGITILTFVLFEYGYRAQANLRRVLSERLSPTVQAPPPHPYAKEEWWRTWRETRPDGFNARFDPYRGWWPTAFERANLTIDAHGRRVIPQPTAHSARPWRVFMFGGSVMWGYTARDSFTIPAFMARELQARGINDVELVNYGQLGFVSTQEVISLLLSIREKDIPNATVFLDGLNDVTTAFQTGSAGHVENEPAAAELWTTARAGWRGNISSIARRSELLARIATLAGRKPAGTPAAPPPSQICDAVATQYRQNSLVAQTLGARFGFATLFFWQPMLASTGKPLSAFERQIGEGKPGLGAVLRQCDAVATRIMSDRNGVDFFSLRDAFDNDSTTAFLDPYGHITERANGVLAHRMVERLLAVRAARRDTASSALGGPVGQ
jgi:hypothetical protein